MNPNRLQRSILVKACYGFSLIFLLLAFWDPIIPLGRGPVDLSLLLDESNSVKPEHNERVWQSFLKWSENLPTGSRINLVRFADQAKLELNWTPVNDSSYTKLKDQKKLPRRRSLDQNVSAVNQAIKTAIRLTSPLHHTALLISSDGVESTGNEKNKVSDFNGSSNLSLFYLPSNDHNRNNMLHIDSINLPSNLNTGESLPISISIDSIEGGQGKLLISLNGKLIHEHSFISQAGNQQVHVLNVSTGLQDINRLQIDLTDERGNLLSRQQRVVSVQNKRQLLYIGRKLSKPLSTRLQQNGWQITFHQPQHLPFDDSFFRAFDLIVLNDVHVADIDVMITKNLSDAVKYSATGLIVLGGKQSFGNGGYRYSILEEILPVLSESSRPLPASAFLFLVDKSGSMEASDPVNNRLAAALRAVGESAKSLRASDESGLMVLIATLRKWCR